MRRRLMAMAMALVLALSLLPVSALAVEGGTTEPEETTNVTLEENLTITEPIVVKSGETVIYDLNGHWLAANLSDGQTLFTVKNGGKLVLTNSGDTGNFYLSGDAYDGDGGQGISCEQRSILEVTNVSFWDFWSDDENGGAISAYNANVTIQNCKFSNNRSEKSGQYSGGGAIYLFGDALTATIEKCEFKANGYVDNDRHYNNTDDRGGGAIHLEGCGTVDIIGNTFTTWDYSDDDGEGSVGNYTNRNGGAIFCRIPGEVTIKGNTIKKCEANGSGGAIAIVADKESSVVLEDNTISENTASERGGGIDIITEAGADESVRLVSGEISWNTAKWGGGIDYSKKDMAPLMLQNVLITGNQAVRGAGIWGCPSSQTETYSTLGGAIYGNKATGEINDWQNNNSVYSASGDEVRYESYTDTDDQYAKRNYELGSNKTSYVTVSQRALGGGLMNWYEDAPNNRYTSESAPANKELYTNAKNSFGLHGELSETYQGLAKDAALLIIKDNIAEQRGGGIATNSPLIIGEKDADITVHVKKVWTGENHPASVVVNLWRVDADGKRVRLDYDIALTGAEGNDNGSHWSATFTDLPSAYIDENGKRQEYKYEVVERPIEGWNCTTTSTVSDDGKTYNIVLTNVSEGCGALKVTKIIAADAPQVDTEFAFTLTYGEKGAEQTKNFTLKNGETKTFSIPLGAPYKVTETNTNDHNPTYVNCDGTLTRENPQADGFVFNVPKDKAALVISKTVNGNDADLNKDFTFTVTLKNDGSPLGGSYNYTGSKTGTITSGGTLTLKSGESISINNLPVGATYEVTETAVEDYTTTVNGNDANMTGKPASGTIVKGSAAVTHFTNTYVPKVPNLKVEKSVDKANAEEGDILTYTVTVTNTGNVTLENIKVNDALVGVKDENIDKLEPGKSWTKEYTYTVKSSDKGTTVLNVVIAAVGELEDSDTAETVIKGGGGGGGGGHDPKPPILNTKDHFGYIIGYPVDYFTGEKTDDQTKKPVKPQGNITRAEVATIFFRMLTDDARTEYWSSTNSYTDVPETAWYNNAVSTLSKAGIIDGYTDGSFRPNGKITRAEFATIAVRFFDSDYNGKDLFPDIDGHWAQDYINQAGDAGIIQGYPDGTFGPQKLITRAEAVTMVNRTLDRHPDQEHFLPDMLIWPDNMDTTKWYYADMQEATNSHEYEMKTSSDGKYEIWTKMLPIRDWEAFEKEWSDAGSATNPGEVVR